MNNYYPYELHCHTDHSDGQMSPKELVERAVQRGYKGIAITDHNTVSSVEEVVNEGKKQGLEVIPGIEWTTFFGHIVALGKDTSVDWREISPKNIDQILERGHKEGLVLTLAHPKRYGTPVCTGCYMGLPITKYQYICGYEVWTQKCPNFNDYNIKALKEYDELLSRGYKIAALYGYDWHRPDYEEGCYAQTFIGQNKDAIESIKDGDTYVSVGLRAQIKVNNQYVPLGTTLKKGEHMFALDIIPHNKEFCDKYGIIPQKIAIKGNAVDKPKEYQIGQEFKIKLTEGYVRFEVIGEEKGYKEKKLLLTSPYYIERR